MMSRNLKSIFNTTLARIQQLISICTICTTCNCQLLSMIGPGNFTMQLWILDNLNQYAHITNVIYCIFKLFPIQYITLNRNGQYQADQYLIVPLDTVVTYIVDWSETNSAHWPPSQCNSVMEIVRSIVPECHFWNMWPTIRWSRSDQISNHCHRFKSDFYLFSLKR